MFVCICHALTDSDVKSAESQGAARPCDVFKMHGVQPQCGRCVPSMCCLLKEKNAGPAVSTEAHERTGSK